MDSVSLVRVTEALNAAWGPDTCAPEDIGDWSEENPARGQCATTAVVVHDYFGGDLVRGEVHVRGERVDFHWRNRLPDGSEIDLTREQFSVQESVIGGVYVPRPTGWTRLDYEYSLLSGRVAEHLKRSPTTFLASQLNLTAPDRPRDVLVDRRWRCAWSCLFVRIRARRHPSIVHRATSMPSLRTSSHTLCAP